MVTQFPLGPHHQILADAACLLFHPPDILRNIRQPLQQAGKGAPRVTPETSWALRFTCQRLSTLPSPNLPSSSWLMDDPRFCP